MKSQNQRGFGTVEMVLVLVIVAIIGFVGWRVYESQQDIDRTNQETRQTSNNQQVAPVDKNEGYVVVKDWGVRFKPVAGLEDVLYVKEREADSTQKDDSYVFTTEQLKQLDKNCSGDVPGATPLGKLVRAQGAELKEDVGEGFYKARLLKQIGSDYYYYFTPQAACGGEKTSGVESESLLKMNQSIKSLEAAK